jgi:hypothetical protein
MKEKKKKKVQHHPPSPKQKKKKSMTGFIDGVNFSLDKLPCSHKQTKNSTATNNILTNKNDCKRRRKRRT